MGEKPAPLAQLVEAAALISAVWMKCLLQFVELWVSQ